ncbi:MAG: hypothetical protein K2Y71_19675 [Xanthobacteraceae bacterium]|nr:hypothetical protein [Xanthobacteraceae bacterium]
MRYLIALGTAILMVAMMWPYLRRYLPRREQQGGAPKPTTRGELIYYAILITLALSFAISTLLWVFGK